VINDSDLVKIKAKPKPYGNKIPPKSEHLQLVVTIPAKNEAANIWKCLSALVNQNSENGVISSKIFEVIVLCNHCDDNTLDLCERFQNTHPNFPLYIYETHDAEINTVGTARRILMDIAATRLVDDGFIIMTDADTQADKFWLNAFQKLQPEPVDLICGIITPDFKGLETEAKNKLLQNRQYLDLVTRLESELYPQGSDPWPRHSHNSGPNMAIRNSVYKQLGGIPPLACLEDIALYQRVISFGYKVKHSFNPVVTTSCRSVSRVPGGFGTQIETWSSNKIEIVEGLDKLIARFKAFTEIRQYYQQPKQDLLISISKRLQFKISEIISLVHIHPGSSSLIIKLENNLKYHSAWNSVYHDIPINEAIQELQNYFAAFFQTSSSYKSSRLASRSLKESE